MQELGRKELLDFLEVIFNFLEEGVLLLDNSGMVTFYNQVAASLEGLHPQQAIGRHIDDLYDKESLVSRALHQALLGSDCDDILLTEFDDRGRPVRIQVQCYPLRLQDRQVGVLRLTRDLALWAPELREKASLLPEESGRDSDLEDGAALLSGKSSFALTLQQRLRFLVAAQGAILIWGPPGSGRSSLARLIHQQASLGRPYLTCDFRFRSATAQELLLLGGGNTLGLWQQALGGSLALEELHLASPRLQNRLVELLAHPEAPRCFLILPGNPEEAVQSGNLHPGLVERAVMQVELLPLSAREDDLPQICQYLLHRINQRLKRRIFGLTPLAKDALQRYPWPGGLRELYSVLEGAVLQASGSVITPDLLPQQLHLVNQGQLSPHPIPPSYPQRYSPLRFSATLLADDASAPLFLPREAYLAAALDQELLPDNTQEAENLELSPVSEPESSNPDEGLLLQPSTRSQQRRYGELEKRMIIDALQIHDNDLRAAAKELGMRETTLRRRLIQYQISIDV
ncbi:MAG: PAS domain-containing protein [Symbiobacteriaceae bacterium]|nr:PAS domain-containing protein [Symbiobacteriaceae bacterium]